MGGLKVLFLCVLILFFVIASSYIKAYYLIAYRKKIGNLKFFLQTFLAILVLIILIWLIS